MYPPFLSKVRKTNNMKENPIGVSKTENILAMILLNSIKEATIAEKVHQLNLAGFTNVEISNFLGIPPKTIAVHLHLSRKVKNK